MNPVLAVRARLENTILSKRDLQRIWQLSNCNISNHFVIVTLTNLG